MPGLAEEKPRTREGTHRSTGGLWREREGLVEWGGVRGALSGSDDVCMM